MLELARTLARFSLSLNSDRRPVLSCVYIYTVSAWSLLSIPRLGTVRKDKDKIAYLLCHWYRCFELFIFTFLSGLMISQLCFVCFEVFNLTGGGRRSTNLAPPTILSFSEGHWHTWAILTLTKQFVYLHCFCCSPSVYQG
jgi:RsiW-degrading membrane proteinase PrsW (M82 family)